MGLGQFEHVHGTRPVDGTLVTVIEQTLHVSEVILHGKVLGLSVRVLLAGIAFELGTLERRLLAVGDLGRESGVEGGFHGGEGGRGEQAPCLRRLLYFGTRDARRTDMHLNK